MTEGDGRRPEVPGYEVGRELGRGGFATVYEARQLSVDRLVALKVVSVSGLAPDVERRFRSELRTIGSLSWHPHVVALHDAGVTPEGLPFLAMELVTGGTWGDRVRDQGALPPEVTLGVGAQVADALGAAHDAGIVHRDVKPENVLVGRRDEALLADFGVALVTDTVASVSGSFTGTLAYAAPELLRGGRADARSDVYAAGATLHLLATGRPAYSAGAEGSPAALIATILEGDPPLLPRSVPAPVRRVVERAMARDPDDRPATAHQLEDELRLARDELARGGAGWSPPPAAGARPPAGPETLAAAAAPAPPPGTPAAPTPATPMAPPPTDPVAPHSPAPTTPDRSMPPPTRPTPAQVEAAEAARLASLPPPPSSVRQPPPGPPPAPPAPRAPAAVPVPVSIPVPVPTHPAPPGPTPGPAGRAPGVWASTVRSLVASTLCCLPVGGFFAVQGHRRLLAAGGRLRGGGARGRVAVGLAYAWAVVMLGVALAVPGTAYLDARDTAGAYPGTWEGSQGGLVLRMTLEQRSAGLALGGSFTTTTDTLRCRGSLGDSVVSSDEVELTATATCDPPTTLPPTVRISLGDDEDTLRVAGFDGDVVLDRQP